MENTNSSMATEQDKAEMQAIIDRLQAENDKLKAQKAHGSRLSLKVSEKGAVSVYGMGRFPVTLYGEQWVKLLDFGDGIREFIVANKDRLSSK